MSLKGLETAEKQAKRLLRTLQVDVKTLTKEAQAQILRLNYLINHGQLNPAAPVRAAQVAEIKSRLTKADQLFLTLKGSPDPENSLFLQRYEAKLRQVRTQKDILLLEADLRMQQFKMEQMTKTLDAHNEIAREASLRQAYDDARKAGGILGDQFSRVTAQDLVTLRTKLVGTKTLGKYMEDLWSNYGNAYIKAYAQSMTANEEGMPTIIERLMKATDITAGRAQLLVRTESNAIFNDQIANAIWENPLIKGFIFRATLDKRTSDACQELDGQYFDKSEMILGVNFPPIHPNCRSTVETVMAYDTRAEKERIARGQNDEWLTVPGGTTYVQFKAMILDRMAIS